MPADRHADPPIRILIGVTFRDFNGSDNERMQRLFIDSIIRQTYPHWRMVVSLFNERNVQPEIEKYGQDVVFHHNGPVQGYKFSLTDVLLNAIDESRKDERTIIIWTTCDVVFPDNFFEEIVRASSPGFVGVSHPHRTYRTLDDLTADRAVPTSANSGIDLLIMDGAIFRDPRTVEIVRKYRFTDWGLFEHFLVGVALALRAPRVNLYGLATIAKIENDRKVGAETNAWLMACWHRNKVPLDAFIADFGLSRELFDLMYCHRQFRYVRHSLLHSARFAADSLSYAGRVIRTHSWPRLPLVVRRTIKRIAK